MNTHLKACSGNTYRRGRLSIVGLLVIASLDQVIFILKILFSLVTKQANLTRRSTALFSGLFGPVLVWQIHR